MQNIKFLKPKFLDRLDEVLLKNYPFIWASNIVETLYSSVIFSVIVTMILLIIPFSLIVTYKFLFIPCLLTYLFIISFYHLERFVSIEIYQIHCTLKNIAQLFFSSLIVLVLAFFFVVDIPFLVLNFKTNKKLERNSNFIKIKNDISVFDIKKKNMNGIYHFIGFDTSRFKRDSSFSKPIDTTTYQMLIFDSTTTINYPLNGKFTKLMDDFSKSLNKIANDSQKLIIKKSSEIDTLPLQLYELKYDTLSGYETNELIESHIKSLKYMMNFKKESFLTTFNRLFIIILSWLPLLVLITFAKLHPKKRESSYFFTLLILYFILYFNWGFIYTFNCFSVVYLSCLLYIFIIKDRTELKLPSLKLFAYLNIAYSNFFYSFVLLFFFIDYFTYNTYDGLFKTLIDMKSLLGYINFPSFICILLLCNLLTILFIKKCQEIYYAPT